MNGGNEKMIEKVKGLLALSQDNEDDAEGQTAFFLAQKLMVKHNIQQIDVEQPPETLRISDFEITSYKKLSWWEKKLAIVIAENFRVKCYFRLERRATTENKKSCIVYYGRTEDWEIAQSLFNLALQQLQFFSEKCALKIGKTNKELFYSERIESYRLGFITGLEAGFHTQRKQSLEIMNQSFLPPEVLKLWQERSEKMKFTNENTPSLEDLYAYHQGFALGKGLDWTEKKETITNET